MRLERYSHQGVPQNIKEQILEMYNLLFAKSRGEKWDTLGDDKKKPVRFLLIDGDKVVSHIAVQTRIVDVSGKTYRVAGVGGVFTRPEYQNKGHASKLLEAADEYINAQNFDVAILFTGIKNFYERAGWKLLENPNIRVTQPRGSGRDIEEEVIMIRYISETARSNRKLFGSGPIFLGEPW